jgi:3-oxoacyl-[acyl-carrier protein] reductase
MGLNDKVVLVTGSSRGIGRAVAEAFAGRGATVVVNSRSDVVAGEQVAREITERGGKAYYLQADVSDQVDVDRLFDLVEQRHGPVNVLVNNAGRTEATPPLDADLQHWMRMLNVNLMSAVLCSVRAARAMTAGGGGTIINTSSVRGFDANGREGVMAYSAAKAALNNFTRTLAKELAPIVRVNAVAPGFVATSYLDRVDDGMKRSWLDNIPLSEFIAPEDIAGAYLYLAEAPYVTGTILAADAGFTLGRG